MFRFQEMEIWRRGAKLSSVLFPISDRLEGRRLYRFAEQLRGSVLSITNNIAEGAGSSSKVDFANFLNISRRSVFETVNILLILQQNGYLEESEIRNALADLEEESRMIASFQKTLKK